MDCSETTLTTSIERFLRRKASAAPAAEAATANELRQAAKTSLESSRRRGNWARTAARPSTFLLSREVCASGSGWHGQLTLQMASSTCARSVLARLQLDVELDRFPRRVVVVRDEVARGVLDVGGPAHWACPLLGVRNRPRLRLQLLRLRRGGDGLEAAAHVVSGRRVARH